MTATEKTAEQKPEANILETEWIGFRDKVLAQDIPGPLMDSFRQVFYSGAHMMYSLGIIGLPDEEVEALQRLSEIHHALSLHVLEVAGPELASMLRALMAERAPQAGSPKSH